MTEPLYTVKITTGSPKLAARLKTDIIMILAEYARTFSDAWEKRAAEEAIGKVRIVQAAK